MESIKVGIREFRSHLPYYLLEVGKPLAITRHGTTIGYYIPNLEKATYDDHAALMAPAERLDAMLQAAGVDTDALVDDFNTPRRTRRPSDK